MFNDDAMLPNEIQTYILSFLDQKALCRVSRASRKANACASNIWYQRILAEITQYPMIQPPKTFLHYYERVYIHLIKPIAELIDINNALKTGQYAGHPALHAVCMEPYPCEIVALHLLKNPALDIDQIDKYQATALHYACYQGKAHLVKLLLERNARLTSHVLGYSSIIDIPLEFSKYEIPFDLWGYEKYSYDFGRNCTPLHYAARSGNLEVVNLLIKYGAADLISYHNYNDETPLHYALLSGNTLVVEKIAEFCSKKALYCYDLKLIEGDYIDKITDELYDLLDKHISRPDGRTILHYAVRSGSPILLKFLLDKFNGGKAINCTTLACQASPLLFACAVGNTQILELLLDYGANIHIVDKWKRNVLHYAAKYGHTTVLNTLLKRGAIVNINQLDYSGFMPLHYAIESKALTAVALLIEFGANKFFIAKLSNENLLHFSLKKCRSVLTMSPVDNEQSLENTFKIFQLLINQGLDINQVNLAGYKPIQIATQRWIYPVIELLFQYGASVYEVDDYGQTLLHLAFAAYQYIPHKAPHHIYSFKKTTEILLKYGAIAHLNKYDKLNQTPLDFICSEMEHHLEFNAIKKINFCP